MSGRRLRLAAAELLALCAVFSAGVAARAPRAPSADPTAFGAQAPAALGVLPAGFVASVDLATSARFVRVVAGDIDRDGDLDVVASVGTLDLLVWENDGAGHFSRLRSSPHQALRAQPPAPALDREDLASNPWIQNERNRDVRPEQIDARAGRGRASLLSVRARVTLGRFGPRVRSPRAPPL